MEMAVVVTTDRKGVFFGYLPENTDLTQTTLRLERVRMCVYWRGIRGVMGLAKIGPTDECRVGPPAPAMTIHQINGVMEISDEARAAWEKAPWKL